MTCEYDLDEKILYAHHVTPVNLENRTDIVRYFDSGLREWRRMCRGEKVYIVVDYTNLTVNIDHIDFYARQVKRIVDECAITIIRYGGELVQRTVGRMTATKIHTPSNMYPDRETARAVVRGIRDGSIRLREVPDAPAKKRGKGGGQAE
jgi:hypothetical protein